MPFKSEKQRRYLWANDPELAEAWEREQRAKRRRANNKKKKNTNKPKRKR